jgi:hypothetical protein
MPGRPLAAQYRTPSDPYMARSCSGSSGALAADLDSFLRSGSTMNPEMAALDHGSESCS